MRISVLSFLFAVSSAKVIEADDKSLPALLESGIPTLLSLYAPWCSHCKTFHPKFDELAAKYEHAQDKIQFIRVDGDSNRKTQKKFDVNYYPTLKYVEGDHNEEIKDRNIDNLENLIKKKTKVLPKQQSTGAGGIRDYVVPLSDSDLDEQVKGKHAVVAFTTTWCGHCKKLKPEWATLAALYANDDDILIGTVDCTEGAGDALSKRFGLKGYPTIIYFPKDGSEPFAYGGARSLQGVSDFLKQEGASLRESTGFLSNDAGLIEELKTGASALIGASEAEIAKFTKQVEDTKSEFAHFYLKFIPKIVENGESYIRKERKRLQGLLKSTVTSKTRDSIKVRLNILKSFLPGAKEDL